jgi:hypothetical protein
MLDYRTNVHTKPHLILDFRMIIFVYFLPNASGLVWAKNLRKWAEKAFVSSSVVFHDLLNKFSYAVYLVRFDLKRSFTKFPGKNPIMSTLHVPVYCGHRVGSRMSESDKQELNSSETSCDRVGGLIGGVIKKFSLSMVERGLVKKVSFSSLERSVVKKYFSVTLD